MLRAILSIGFTLVITYQIYYNYRAVEDMGDGYLNTSSLFYNLVALIPALFLGIHCIKTEFADDKLAYV